MLQKKIFIMICIFCVTFIFAENKSGDSLEQRGKNLFLKLAKNAERQPVTTYLLEQWKVAEKRSEIRREYIRFIDDYTAELFSENGVSPRVHNILFFIAPFYVFYFEENGTKKQRYSYVLALLTAKKIDEAEDVLREILHENPLDRNANLLAGFSFPLKKDSPLFQEKWSKILKAPSKEIITVGFILWNGIFTENLFSYRIKMYEIIMKNKNLLENITKEQKGNLMCSYLRDLLVDIKGLSAKKNVFEKIKLSEFYTHLASSLKGEKVTLAFSEDEYTCNLFFNSQQKKDAPFQSTLKFYKPGTIPEPD